MSTDPSTPENDANLSALGRELLDTGGSKPSGPWMPPTAEELHKLLPEYEIVKMLGRGGMGAVYMGKQISLDRPVAIKILSGALEDSDASFAERFKNEAKAMGKLTHPGIVAVHDFGETEGGLLYIVMEFVEGTDVSRMIAKEGRLHTEHAMAITAHVCDALGYAHERGIIHRDIKPANIMVGYDGVVKVADFGLAKMTQSANTGLTQSGMAMGTLHYMAPEALMLGGAVDHRADIYAVGVMLYQMLVGKLPQGIFELPSTLVPGLDPRYDGIISKALREDREVRYQNIRDMRADLDSILTRTVVKVEEEAEKAPAALPTQARPQRTAGQPYRPPPSAPPQPHQAAKSSSGGLAWLSAGVIVVAAGAYLLLRGGNEAPSAPRQASPSESTPAPSSAKTPTAAVETSGRESSWPTGPHYRSAGRFRAWSSIPDDPLIDLAAAAKLTDVRQVHLRHNGWIVVTNDGAAVDDKGEVKVKKEIQRLFPGHMGKWSVATEKGDFFTFPWGEKAIGAIPKDMGVVVDAYSGYWHKATISSDGSFRIWGNAFDGVEKKGNFEWKVKPSLDPAEKAAQLASTEIRLAVRLTDGRIKVWGGLEGVRDVPGSFAKKRMSAIAMNQTHLFGLPASGGDVLGWKLDGDRVETAPFGTGMEVVDFIANHGVVLAVLKDGRLVPDSLLEKWVEGMSEVIASIGPINPDHISIYATSKEPRCGRIIWYDDPNRAASAPVVQAPSATTSGPSKPTTAVDKVVPDGPWENLLPRLMSAEAESHGDWISREGALVCQSPGDYWGCAIPSRKMENYHMRIRYVANDCETVRVFFPSPDGPTKLSLRHETKTMFIGSEESMMKEKGMVEPLNFPLDDGREHLLECRVMQDSFQASLDGKVIYERKIEKWADLDSKSPVKAPIAFGVGVHQGVAEFRSFEIQTLDAPASAPAVPEMPPATAPPLFQLAGFRDRVGNYQTARQQKFADLTGKYRNALVSAQAEAAKTGNLKHVEAIQLATSRAETYAAQIEKLAGTMMVEPLSSLPPLSDDMPDSLKKLREIFDRETVKMEIELVTALELSLTSLQESWVKSRRLEDSRMLEAYRQGLAQKFPKPEALPQVATTAPATPATPTAPAAQQPPKPLKEVKGRLRGWGYFSPGSTQKALQMVAHWKDFVAIEQRGETIHALRADGTPVILHGERDVSKRAIEFELSTKRAEDGRTFRSLGLSGEGLTLLDDQGGVYYGYNSSVYPVHIDGKHVSGLVDAVNDNSYMGHGIAKDGSLVWWGSHYSNSSSQRRWKEPPAEAQKGIVKVAGSNDLAAAINSDGRLFVWGLNGAEHIQTHGKKFIDVEVCMDDRVFALSDDGEVRQVLGAAVKSNESLAKDVVSMKGGESPICRRKDGSLSLLVPTDKSKLWVYDLLLKKLGHLPDRAYSLSDVGLFWIEPEEDAAANAAIDLMRMEEWTTTKEPAWQVVDETLVSGGSARPSMYRVLPFPSFEMTGQFKISSQATGAIAWGLRYNPEHVDGIWWYEMRFRGSRYTGRSGESGSIFGRAFSQTNDKTLHADNEWTSFKLEVAADRFKGWIAGQPVFDVPPSNTYWLTPVISFDEDSSQGELSFKDLKIVELP